MKLIKIVKVVFFSMLLLCMTLVSNAQELGIRTGVSWGNNAAIDAIFSAGKYSRIHADLSFGSGVSAEALWDFVYKPLGSDGIHWYAGAGVATFFGSSNFQLGIPGEIGLEYRFKKAPLALGMDWRPVFVLVENTSLNAGEFGLNFRYVFGK
jgi:hypothetical protein